ncbi:MAG TPA: dTMP kinase [Sphingomicrobium sp.]|nr:dTMP kinase [Sphingomicrobium sp.]
MRGKFISLEGGEGVGKSTQARGLAKALRELGIEVVETREPGGSEGAERIRKLLLDPKESWSVRTEALLFAAARAEHVEKTIVPALEAGKWVISDRFLDSSLAYQGGAGRLGIEPVREINRFGIDEILPDRTFVLLFGKGSKDSLARAKLRDKGGSDRIGGRSLDFHYEVFLAFQHIHAEEPDRVKLVDASGTPEEVTKLLVRAIQDLLP